MYVWNLSMQVGDFQMPFLEKCCCTQLEYYLQTDDDLMIISLASSYRSDLNEKAIKQDENPLWLELHYEQIFNRSANAVDVRNLVAIFSSYDSIPPRLPLRWMFIVC